MNLTNIQILQHEITLIKENLIPHTVEVNKLYKIVQEGYIDEFGNFYISSELERVKKLYQLNFSADNKSNLVIQLNKNTKLENLPYTGEITSTPTINSEFIQSHNIIYGDINTAIENSEIIIDENNKYKISFDKKLKLPEYSAGLFASYNDEPSEMKYCKEIDLSNVDVNDVVNGAYLFDNCSGLETLDLSKFTGENLVNATGMFENCTSLESLDLSSFTGKNLTDATGMFENCSSLESLDLSSFTGKNLTDSSYMFENCSSLETLDLSSFTGENLTNSSNMFNGCSDLNMLDLSSFTGEKLENSSSMFENCTNLTYIDLSSFTGEILTDASSMFENCSSLETLDLSSFTGENLTNSSNMFENCTNLTTLTITGTAINKLAETGAIELAEGIVVEDNVVYTCSCDSSSEGGIKITKAKSFSKTSLSELKNMYTWQNASDNNSVLTFDFKGKNIELEDLPYEGDINDSPTLNAEFVEEHNIIYGEINDVIAASDIAINENNKYKITFNNGTLVLPQYSAGLFAYYNDEPSHMQYCKEIDLSNVDMNNIVNASYMFNSCSGLTSLDLSEFTGENLTNANEMFYNCRSLTSLNLSKFTGENLVNALSMFFDCQNLTSLDLSSFTGESLEKAPSMLANCKNLTSLDLRNFTGEKLTSAYATFYMCEKLTSLDLRNFTGEKLTDVNMMFYNCSSLASLTMKGSAINIIISLENSYLSLNTGITVDNDKTYRCACTYGDYSTGIKITAVTEI